MLDWNVRRALASDAEGLLALHARVAADAPWFLAYELDPASGAEVLQAKLAGDSRAGDAILAAGDPIVGAALLRKHRHPAFAGVLQLAVSVDPSSQRQGVGRALVAGALAEAERLGTRRVQLAVIERNLAAVSLFEAMGFEREGCLRSAAVIGETSYDVIPMAKLLA